MANIGEQLAFLRHVLPAPAEGQSYFYCWKKPGDGTPWCTRATGSLEELAATSNRLAAEGADTYFATGVFNGQGVRAQANSLGAKALWADVDCGAGKPYPDAQAAIPAVAALCKACRLPPPTMVASGGGLHCYWVLDRHVEPAEWLELAQRLRQAAKAAGLEVDPSRACDLASVLRLPGTLNYKRAADEGGGRVVRVGRLQPPVSVDYLLERLPAVPDAVRVAGHAGDGVPAELRKYLAYDDERPVYADDVADRCQWIRHAGRELAGNVPEPEWYALLGLVQFLDSADDVAVEWSDGHPTFTEEETARKLAQARERQEGPTTCAHFQSLNPKGCEGCPVKGQVTTPLQLGKGKWLRAFEQPAGAAPSVSVPLNDHGPVATGQGDGAFTTRLKPVIRMIAGNIPSEVTEAEKAILTCGMNVYVRDRNLVETEEREIRASRGRRTIVGRLAPLGVDRMLDLLMQAATWEKWSDTKKNWVAAAPTERHAKVLLARAKVWALPRVDGIISTPTLRPNGSLLDKAGYDPETRLFLTTMPKMPAMPDAPTRADALGALALLDELLTEFPFVDGPSRSVAFSALITPVARGAFNLTPMHVARAPTAGSGKSYLFDVAAAIALGQACPVMSAGDKEEELEKRLGSALMEGQTVLSIDNVNGELRGNLLCQVIEQENVSTRILGKSVMVRLDVRSTIFATGNNIVLPEDMNRRHLLCSLDSGQERPELRKFNAKPVDKVAANRGLYIAATLTIVRAYILAGMPGRLSPLNSFEGWSDTVRSALVWLGCADPELTMNAARGNDSDLQQLGAVLVGVANAIGKGEDRALSTPSILLHGATGPFHDALSEVCGATNGQLSSKLLGKWFKQRIGKMCDGLKLNGKINRSTKNFEWWVS